MFAQLGAWAAGLFKRASPIPITPEWDATGFGLASDQASQHYNLSERNGIPELATRAIANRVAALRWVTKRTIRVDAETTRDEILDDHPATQLLANPHPDFTGQQVFRLVGEGIVNGGEAYWLKVRNAFNRPATMQPLQQGSVAPVVRLGVVRSYTVTDGKGDQHTIPRNEIVRFWWPDLATLYTARGYFGPNWRYNDTLKFQAEHMRRHWQNDATPKIILRAAHEFATDPDDATWTRFLKVWRQAHDNRSGARVGLPAPVPTGWDVVQMAAQSGADVAPLLEWLQSEQLMNFGVPNALLGRVVSGDRSSAEATSWIFDQYTITPIADLIKDTLTQQVARDFDDSIWIDYEPFVAPDKAFELERDVALTGAKIISPNEARTERGHDEATWGEFPPGTFGDEPYTGESSRLDPEPPPTISDAPEEGQDVDDDTEDEPRSRAWLARRFSPKVQWTINRQHEAAWAKRMDAAVRRLFVAQETLALETLRKLERELVDDIFEGREWEELWELIVFPVLRDTYTAAVRQTLRDLGQRFVFTEAMQSMVSRQAFDMVQNVDTTTIGSLRETLKEAVANGESINRIETRINEVFGERRRNSRTIARTETLRAQQGAQVESYNSAGVERRRWNSQRDGVVRQEHTDSLIPPAPQGQPFEMPGGYAPMYPGDPSLPARLSINCRCFVTPLLDPEIEALLGVEE